MAGWHTNADLYHQWEEAEARAESWEKKCQEERRQHRQEISRLREEFRREIAEMRSEMRAQVRELEKENKQLKAENQALREDNLRLKSIINQNSNNSSKPPSSDQKPARKAANEYNGREKTTRTRGGQPGHKGTSLTKQEAESLIAEGKVRHEIITIGEAQRSGAEYISKYEYELVCETLVREYRYYADAKGKYHIPKQQRTDVWYGDNLKALAVALFNIGVMSTERIKELLNEMSDHMLHLSEGSIYNFIRRFSKVIEPDLQHIENDLLNQTVLMTDGTNVTVCGEQSYIRNVSSERSVRYYGMDRKNLASLNRISVLRQFQGILVHDHETALYHFGGEHAECNVHLLRYLTKNSEDTRNPWSGKLRSLLCETNRARKQAMQEGKTAFPPEQISRYEAEYDRILQEGRQQNASTRLRWARDDEKSLLNRLEKYKQNHLLFLHRFDVPFDNNMSERDLRKCKNRQKMSGGFGKSDGRDMACAILSFVESCKRRSLNILSAIRSAFTAPVLIGH